MQLTQLVESLLKDATAQLPCPEGRLVKASRIDQGTVAVRQTGSFNIQTATTAIQSISHCKIIQQADGYAFSSHPTDSTHPQKEAARAGSRFA